MQPNQPGQIPQPPQSTNYPPQPNPVPGNSYPQPGVNPQIITNQPQAAPQPSYQPGQAPAYQPPNTMHQPAPQAYQGQYPNSPANVPQSAPNQPQPSNKPQPASWYAPANKEPDNKPSSVDSYLSAAKSTPTQPNQPQPNGNNAPGQVINGQYAVDYLGGIAPTQPTDDIKIAGKSIDKKIFFVGLGVIGALILAGMLMLFTPKKQGIDNLNESSFYSSMVATSEITKKAGKNIKNSQLKAINSSLNSQLLGSMQEMAEPLSQSGIDAKALETAAKKPGEEEQKKLQTLEDARLNATYDRAYSREMRNRLETMLITLDRIKKINSRESMQSFVESVKPKFESLKKSLEDLSI